MKPIDCRQHGPSRYSLICSHLREREGLGYFAIEGDETEPAQAWCEACEVVLTQERGWTERAATYAGRTKTCSICLKNRLRSQTLISEASAEAAAEV